MFDTDNSINFSITDLESYITKANIAYYNLGKPLLDDDLYDYYIDCLEKKDPNNLLLKKVGQKIDNKDKVKLPYYMGSLHKIKNEKDTKTLRLWIENNNPKTICLSDKLDGFSGMVVYNTNGTLNVYTRGDGEYGMDITQLYSYLDLPIINDEVQYAVRGELIIKKKDIEECKKYMRKKNKNTPSRSLVSSVTNAKTSNKDIAKYIQFVAYELVEPRVVPEEQFRVLRKLGFKVVDNQLCKVDKLSNEYLEKLLVKRRNDSEYEIDGIVITNNTNNDVNEDERPKFSIAFKMNLGGKTTKVRYIDWIPSKDGILVPVVIIDPVLVDDSVIKKISGSNANKMKELGIGEGAIIIVEKAGQTIPNIKDVVKKGKINLPKCDYFDDGVNFIAKGDALESDDIKMKLLENFVSKLGVKKVSKGTIKKLFGAGYTNIYDLLYLESDDLKEIDGIGPKSSVTICNNIDNALNACSIVNVMDASNCFERGLGGKKLDLIITSVPNYNELDSKTLDLELNDIKGVSKKTAEKFISGLEKFNRFIKGDETLQKVLSNKKKAVKIVSKPSTSKDNTKDTTSKVHSGSVVFTGIRDKDLKELLTTLGFKVTTSVSGKTKYVIVKTYDLDNNKTKAAKKKGIPMYTVDDFQSKVLEL